jgi:hypothetical protein
MPFGFPVLSLGPPVKTEINNGILKSVHAMPFKDSTSDGTSTFAMSRRDYIRSSFTTPTFKTNAITSHKKWMGNRDASSVTAHRRVNQVGKGTINTVVGMAFKTTHDTNTPRDALRRVRNSGSAVPAKKVHNYPNAPVFY